MDVYRLLLFVPLAAAVLFAAGCPDRSEDRTSSPDDGTSGGEENEEYELFDDDDGPVEGPDEIFFSLTLDAEPLDVGDDDDAPSPAAAREIRAEFRFLYRGSGNALSCDQRVEIRGRAWFGDGIVETLGDVGTCASCTGFLEFDPATYLDITATSGGGARACDLAVLQDLGSNWGVRLLSPPDPAATPPTHGDFLSLALWDAETHAASGVDLTVAPEDDHTAEGATAAHAELDRLYTHAAFVRAVPESVAVELELGAVTRRPEPGSDYLFAWLFSVPTHEAPEVPPVELLGTYDAEASFAVFFR